MKKALPKSRTVSDWARTIGVHKRTVKRRLLRVGKVLQRDTLHRKRHAGGFEYYAFESDVLVAFPNFAEHVVETRKLSEIKEELDDHRVAIARLTQAVARLNEVMAKRGIQIR